MVTAVLNIDVPAFVLCHALQPDVIAISGVWMIVLGLQRKHTTQESPTSTGGSAPSSCQNSPQEARRSQHAAAQQGVEPDVE